MKQYQSKDQFVVTYSRTDDNRTPIFDTIVVDPEIPDGSYSDGRITLFLLKYFYQHFGTSCSIINWWLYNEN